MEPSASRGTRMIALHRGAHGALVKPSRFVDILMDDSMSLALTNDRGILINELNAPDRALVPAPLGKSEKGMTEDTIYAVSRRDDLVAIAMEPRSNVAEQVRRERILFLPAGAIVAALVVGIVAWLSKRRLSPLAELVLWNSWLLMQKGAAAQHRKLRGSGGGGVVRSLVLQDRGRV